MDLPVLGIDVSKAKFQACLLVAGKAKSKSCSNSAEGFAQLISWLERQGAEQVHACMEATGTYWEALATFLADRSHLVSVVNPAQVLGFAKSELIRTKTDGVDAGVIARFCQAIRPALWSPMPREVRELRSLVRRLADLQDMHQMEHNRLLAGELTEAVETSIRTLLEQLELEIRNTKHRIKKHFDDHPGLKAQRKLLTSIPGIGDQTAAVILGEIGDASQFRTAKQLACYAGLTPMERQSGKSSGKARLSKIGNSILRKALFFPAITATKHNLFVAALAGRMKQRGKAKMSVIGAAMRKLLHQVFGILRSGTPFSTQQAA